MNLQPVFDIPEVCYQLGVRQAVISPGSRNGALTIAFARHHGIECYSIPDERSAGFIALGMSLQSKVPTVLICTSGSAGLNYAPAVAEAFFNRVPLLVITADRPPSIIGIRDGQTIYQQKLYGPHVKYFDQVDIASSAITQNTIVEAIQYAQFPTPGPVHLNIPFEEPFYPEIGIEYRADPGIAVTQTPTAIQPEAFPLDIKSYRKILIVVGQQDRDTQLLSLLSQVASQLNIPVLGDVIANTHSDHNLLRMHDFYVSPSMEALKPDLVLTVGMSVLSKKLKTFLRSSDAEHWHIGLDGDSADTYGKLSRTIRMAAHSFFSELIDLNQENDAHYRRKWQEVEHQARQLLPQHLPTTYCETTAYHTILSAIPTNTDVHLANSMTVRYANFLGLCNSDIRVYCNRGTSGIDGTNSTAVGSALLSQQKTIILTGDVALLYDRNAFWHNHLPDRLLLVIFNNQGGGIFRLIPGPSKQPELEEFFETKQRSSARYLAAEFGFRYHTVENKEELHSAAELVSGFENGRLLIEIFTDKYTNEEEFKKLNKKMSSITV